MRKKKSFVFFQSDDVAAAQNLAESPIDSDPADVTEVRHNFLPETRTYYYTFRYNLHNGTCF